MLKMRLSIAPIFGPQASPSADSLHAQSPQGIRPIGEFHA